MINLRWKNFIANRSIKIQYKIQYDIRNTHYKQASLKLLTTTNNMFFCMVAWGWLRPKVTNDEDNKWCLPTWDPKWKKEEKHIQRNKRNKTEMQGNLFLGKIQSSGND